MYCMYITVNFKASGMRFWFEGAMTSDPLVAYLPIVRDANSMLRDPDEADWQRGWVLPFDAERHSHLSVPLLFLSK